MPTAPPIRQMDTASIRNCSRMVRRRAPRALRVPISFVRSFTLTKVMFMMPMAPTKSDRPVMNRPAKAMALFHRIQLRLEGLLLVDGKIVALAGQLAAHPPHGADELLLGLPQPRLVRSPSPAGRCGRGC